MSPLLDQFWWDSYLSWTYENYNYSIEANFSLGCLSLWKKLLYLLLYLISWKVYLLLWRKKKKPLLSHILSHLIRFAKSWIRNWLIGKGLSSSVFEITIIFMLFEVTEESISNLLCIKFMFKWVGLDFQPADFAELE